MFLICFSVLLCSTVTVIVLFIIFRFYTVVRADFFAFLLQPSCCIFTCIMCYYWKINRPFIAINIDRSGDIVLLINIIRGDTKNVNISELMLEDERDGGMS